MPVGVDEYDTGRSTQGVLGVRYEFLLCSLSQAQTYPAPAWLRSCQGKVPRKSRSRGHLGVWVAYPLCLTHRIKEEARQSHDDELEVMYPGVEFQGTHWCC